MALTFLADKSALARVRHASVAARISPLIVSGDVGCCGVIELEILFSATSAADFGRTRARLAAMPRLPTLEADFVRAADVLEALCRAGHHRAVSIPDLLIAAIAEREGLGVLHYDKDFDLIARETKQQVDWVVPAGSVP